MIQKVSTERGAKELHKVLKKEEVRDYDLEDIFTRSPQTVNGLVNRGRHFLQGAYPNRLREATNAVAEGSNISKNNSSKLSKIAAPLAITNLAKHVQDGNLNVDQLKSLLNGQKDAVKNALPENFVDAAELSAFGWTKKEVVKEPEPPKPKKEKPVKPKKVEKKVEKKTPVAPPPPVAETKSGLGFFKWLIPVLALLGLIWLFAIRGCSTDVADKLPAVPNVKEAITETATKVTDATTSAFGKVNDAAMGLLEKTKFAAGSAGEQMLNFVKGDAGDGDGRFRFTNLNFASGSATIAGESGAEVDNLSSILKAYEDIKVKIEGYTDSKGNPDSNQVLSQQRAEAVRSRLIASGISDARITTEGFGAANPVATNDTAEGRAENRRIEIVIIQ